MRWGWGAGADGDAMAARATNRWTVAHGEYF